LFYKSLYKPTTHVISNIISVWYRNLDGTLDFIF